MNAPLTPLTIDRFLGRDLDDRSAPRIVLLGFPSDEGVRRNNGRAGASLAPAAIRDALRAATIEDDPTLTQLLACTRDAGNVPVLGQMELDQKRLGQAVGSWLRLGSIPIILGGGHETAYGHFLGHVNAGQTVAILNWDAHADVKNLAEGMGHSGTPFRQAVLHSSRACRQYVGAGLLEERLDPSYLEFIAAHGGKYVMCRDLSPEVVDRLYSELHSPLMATFDMDAVDRAFAPGVSAPAAGGLEPELWLRAAFMAGRYSQTLSMDVAEINPKFDTADGRTARLAAATVLSFIRGIAARAAAGPGDC